MSDATTATETGAAEPALSEEITWLEDGQRVALVIDEELYPRDAIYGAAYLFVDRCWVFLDRPSDRKVEVRLKPKGPSSPEILQALAGEFANELLNQVLRVRIGDSTRKIREYYMARAFFSTSTQSSIDQLLAELDEEELAQDDLEIQVPWEASAAAAPQAPVAKGGEGGEDASGD